MFSKNLSISVLGICDSRELSYETASELCDLSPRYFGSIARGKTSPTVNTLEKLCIGLEKTPNELLGFSSDDEELSYRLAMRVTHYRVHSSFNATFLTFPVCPRCHCNIERDFQPFCSNCGQKLNWDFFQHAALMPIR
ncbi:MAG: helix-turn-helix transcriptional regulator [Clostridiales bacterium]|nr:helix-turn-helix transcriptional regulator [Clostridiales bacterium]